MSIFLLAEREEEEEVICYLNIFTGVPGTLWYWYHYRYRRTSTGLQSKITVLPVVLFRSLIIEMSRYIEASSEGRYRVDGGDWSVDDPDPESGIYEAGGYQDPEAPPAPQMNSSSVVTTSRNKKDHKEGARGGGSRKPVLTIETEPLFFNPSRIRTPEVTSENDIEASASYSYVSTPSADASTPPHPSVGVSIPLC